MPRLAIFNMLIGFAVLFFAAAAGAFIATDITQAFLRDKAILETWQLLLQKSSHGHTNLFATIHICFGLTLPYSVLSPRIKLLQTLGLMSGTLAMGPFMLMRAALGPVDGTDVTEILIGALLSCALAAIGVHAFGLAVKFFRRG